MSRDVTLSPKRVEIWHNILWSRYKATVFSALHLQAEKARLQLDFFHIAETDSDRAVLSPVDLSVHQYPYEVLFGGSYRAVSSHRRILTAAGRALRSPADLVVLPGYSQAEDWVQLFIHRLRGKKIGVFSDSTEHDNPPTWYKRMLKRVFLSRVDAAFCYGSRSRENLLTLGVPNEKIFTRYQAASLPQYDPCSVLTERVLARTQAAASVRVLYVGRLSSEKGLDTLIVWAAAHGRKLPELEVRIIGSGPAEPQLKALVSELRAADLISFVGPRSPDQLRQEYLDASLLVLPSASEPWGLVVNEALAYGCPVLVSNRCGCVPELVHEGVSGYVFDYGDRESFSRAFLQTVSLSMEVERTARSCLETVAPFNPHNSARQICEGLLAVLGQTCAPNVTKPMGR